MKWVVLCALASGLALMAVGCGSAGKRPTAVALSQSQVAVFTPLAVDRSHASSRGPFVPGGMVLARGTVGGGLGDIGDGQVISCVPGGLYAPISVVRNRSGSAVTLMGATGTPDRDPRIIKLVATQLRLEALPHGIGLGGGIEYGRRWSSAPAHPVAIPAGRSALVQTNFRMAHCDELGGGTLVVPDTLFLTYRAGRKIRVQRVTELGLRIFLTFPTRRPCSRVLGRSSKIVATNVSCQVAQRAAIACDRLSSGGTCQSNGDEWDCWVGAEDRSPKRWHWARTDSCWLRRNKSHQFTVSWGHTA